MRLPLTSKQAKSKLPASALKCAHFANILRPNYAQTAPKYNKPLVLEVSSVSALFFALKCANSLLTALIFLPFCAHYSAQTALKLRSDCALTALKLH